MSAAPPLPVSDANPGLPGLLAQAARGGRVAQTALAGELLAMGDRGVIRPLEAWAGVELLARFAAVQGDADDQRGLASVLLLRGDWEMAQGDQGVAANLYAEAVQIFDRLADEGDEGAAETVVRAGRLLPAVVFEKARGASLLEE